MFVPFKKLSWAAAGLLPLRGVGGPRAAALSRKRRPRTGMAGACCIGADRAHDRPNYRAIVARTRPPVGVSIEAA